MERWVGLYSQREKAGLLGGLGFGWVASGGEKLDLWGGLGGQSTLWAVLLANSLLVGLEPGSMVQESEQTPVTRQIHSSAR